MVVHPLWCTVIVQTAFLTAGSMETDMKHDNQNIPDVHFLDGCVDECAINGDMIVREYVFSYGRRQWNPKVVE